MTAFEEEWEDEWKEGTENVKGGWSAPSDQPDYGGRGGQQSGARGDNGYSRGGQSNFDRQENSYSRGSFNRDNGFSRGGQSGFNRRDDGGGFPRHDSSGNWGGNSHDGESGFNRGGQNNDGGNFGNRGGRRNDNDYSPRTFDGDRGRSGGFRGNDQSSNFGRGGGGGYRNDSNRGRSGGFSRDGPSSFGRQGGFGRSNDEDGGGFTSSGFSEKAGFGDVDSGGSGFRGRGRGGRGGGRFSNDGFSGARAFENPDEEDDTSNFQSRGGRGGGGGRGRGDRRGDEGFEEKPREVYIPPEDTNDENEIYGSGITSGINFDKYDKIDVKVSGAEPPPSMTSFESSGLRQALVENVRKAGYRKPTPVQKAAVPIIMAGRDLMACAQTGSGKTAAFLLPILHAMMVGNLSAEVSPEGAVLPYAIILSPTRELALQIHNEARKFALHTIIKSSVVYGGTQVSDQIRKLAQGAHLITATPGRLDDLTNRGRISYSNVRYVVLDEADRMLDMGFLPAIEKFLNNTSMQPPGERVTLMFSATFPTQVQELASKFLSNYLFLAVGIVGGACSDVEQSFHQVSKFEKRKQLEQLLTENNKEKTMVFVETKRTADFIATYLSDKGIPTTSIHGDRFQSQREEALRTFRFGSMRVLVATAVAARGLDIKDVEHVINYDLPKSIDEYVHRIGRTGRVGNCGRATSFYDAEVDRDLASHLVRNLIGAQQSVPEWLQQDAEGGGMSNFGRADFGGSDIRKFEGASSSGHFSAPTPVEPEESWD